MFDAQAWWARDVILGKIAIPSQEEMHKASMPWEEKEAALGNIFIDHFQKLVPYLVSLPQLAMKI